MHRFLPFYCIVEVCLMHGAYKKKEKEKKKNPVCI
jgi:hypothetical protein